jgi:hypothetical protein
MMKSWLEGYFLFFFFYHDTSASYSNGVAYLFISLLYLVRVTRLFPFIERKPII